MSEITYQPIGIIHSQFKRPEGTPIQPTAAKEAEGTVELFPKYVEGLKDLEGFSHIILVYHFHLIKEPLLKVKPFMDNHIRGIFSTRAPSRPNPIGISITRLLRIEGNMLFIRNIDVVDGTFLLDVKPYVPEFDRKEFVKIGWLEKNVEKLSTSKDDGRFQND